ncbi:MAG: helix-turn-helix transcriptional regulator [Clostridia bacterium]|nr:helix-turn-helix transcriptional regulator [Clostridia bacterium]
MNRLKQLRNERALTQADVAKHLNITRQGYANYENEVTNPTPTILIKLADYFECSVDYLIGRESEIGTILINHSLTETENELLQIYRKQTEQKKQFLMTFARGLNDKF